MGKELFIQFYNTSTLFFVLAREVRISYVVSDLTSYQWLWELSCRLGSVKGMSWISEDQFGNLDSTAADEVMD